MKILVIDDTRTHRQAAQAQLAGHEVTVAASYDEALAALAQYNDGKQLNGIKQHGYDVVLVDLLMPASGRQIGQQEGQRLVGQEMPLGMFLVLMAAKGGATYAAIYTDSNHHAHPAAAAIDPFMPFYEPIMLNVDGCRVMLSNDPNWSCYYDLHDLATPLSYDEVSQRCPEWFSANGQQLTEARLVRTKSWNKVLDRLMK